jgi:hypothetical protein
MPPNIRIKTIITSNPITFPNTETIFNIRISRIISNIVSRILFILLINFEKKCQNPSYCNLPIEKRSYVIIACLTYSLKIIG